MAKGLIIDSVDVSGCDCLDGEYCITDKEATFASLCADKDCLYKQLKRKEQELQELTERLVRTEEELKEECTRCAMTNQLDEQIETLQAENEKLKKVICKIEKFCHSTVQGGAVVVILGFIKQAKGEE